MYPLMATGQIRYGAQHLVNVGPLPRRRRGAGYARAVIRYLLHPVTRVALRFSCSASFAVTAPLVSKSTAGFQEFSLEIRTSPRTLNL